MPNTKSAQKALRNSERKRIFNKRRKNKIQTALKELRRVLATNPKEYQTVLSKVFSALDKAAKAHTIHKNKADRKKARVAKMVEKALKTK
jgi:small subunit ribosomal protein S20